MRTVSITVYGKVQGVFFRKHTVAAAEKNKISGFVKNTSDGHVYIEARGSESSLHEFLKWVHTGSPAAKVEKVEVNFIEETEYTGFKVRY